MTGNLFEQVFLTVKPFTAVLDLLYQKQTVISVFYLFVFLYLIIFYFFIFYREHVDQNALTKPKGLLWSRNQL